MKFILDQNYCRFMNSPIFELTSFAPFVQFVAGIYLVFLYDQIFKNNPLAKQIESINDLLQDLVNENQGFLSEEDIDKVEEFKAKRGIKWDNQFFSLKKISFVSFLFCLSLLCYIGLEKWMLSNNWEQSLIVPSLILLLYNSLIFFVPGKRNKLATCRFAGTLFILLIIYVIVFCFVDQYIFYFTAYNKTVVYLLVLVSMSYGMFVYASILIFKCIKFMWIKHQMKKIPKKMNAYLSVKIGIKDVEGLRNKEKEFLLKMSVKTKRPITEIIDDLIKDEFQKSYQEIIKK